MINRDVYSKDPSTRKLVNTGVVTVNDETSEDALAVLRWELENFVCEGQYRKGMQHLLEEYLKNIDQAYQPAVWISGFYGSGKSHLVKMLRALWVDTRFEDGTSARILANLPQSVADLFKELDTQAKRYGGLHAASGTLGAGADGSVRLALLRIVLKSVGLPEKYWVARFIMWLCNEGLFDQITKDVEAMGYDWQEELSNFHVAEGLRKALVKAKPNLFSSEAACGEALSNQFPKVDDISNDEMITTIKQSLSKNGKFPLTLIVLDEVQQYIGENSQRSIDVQEVVEACCKNIGGKLLFIGTGQTALTGTPSLKKLEGRFTIRVELSDSDVGAVIRQVILAKKPDAIKEINRVIKMNQGEISGHLQGTKICHRQDDNAFFSQDYPILPVRRRFWETTLQVLDRTGTESQLRNQLSMVHKVIQSNLDKALGHVIAADHLFFECADKLLQSRILPRNFHEKTMIWVAGSDDEKLMGRACGLIFLINKLAGSNTEVGIKATIETLAELMVEDLSEGSSVLRTKLPSLLKNCELLMQVGDEYRIQTEESIAWNDEFLSQRHQLANEPHRIEAERDGRIRTKINELLKKASPPHGAAKVSRDAHIVFDSQLSGDAEKKVTIWVRDGWSIDENSVQADARQAGNESPTIFVFIPKRSADYLRHHFIQHKAAIATLDKRGTPSNPEGIEARAAMETTKKCAENKINELLDEAFNNSRVFQGGGSELSGDDLLETVRQAINCSLRRLYPQFSIADHSAWDKVYTKAKQGSPDALKLIGDDGDPGKNAVCKGILTYIAVAKKGCDIRNQFETPPYGWSGDAIDGGLQVLLVAGLICAKDERGRNIDPKNLERKAIGGTTFKVESTTLSTEQRIHIRKLLQRIDINAKPGEELDKVAEFLMKARILADKAGGASPRPERPDTALLDEIHAEGGNEQLLVIFNKREELKTTVEIWKDRAQKIDARIKVWEKLQLLLDKVSGIEVVEEARLQAKAIDEHRLLMLDPDPTVPLLKSVEDALRKTLDTKQKKYKTELSKALHELEMDESWKQLAEDARTLIRTKCDIIDLPEIQLGTYQDLLAALMQHPLPVWKDRIDALSGRFLRARALAAQALEPKTLTVPLPRQTLRSAADLDAWMKKVQDKLTTAIAKGPVIVG